MGCGIIRRFPKTPIAAKLLTAVLAHPRVKRLFSSNHFWIDGILVDAWASMKSFPPKDASGEPPAAETRHGFFLARSAPTNLDD